MKLRSQVSDEADIVDEDVVNFPIRVDKAKLVINQQVFHALCDNLVSTSALLASLVSRVKTTLAFS
jgi:hypothetical protein